jgi:hypothetical protein
MRRRLREGLADFEAALAIALELERRRQRRACLALGRITDRQRFSGILGEFRLGIECIDLRRAAVEKKCTSRFARG